MLLKFIAVRKRCTESSVLHGAPYSGCVSVMRWDKLIQQNRRIITREISVELSISKETVHHINYKKGCGKVCAQWVPKYLREKQKTARMCVCLTQQFLH
ncbi:hypothetical protein AVEN_185695-1 [Araneus ventricosus]|uniref:Transposase Tc1-like domain-containing protein n=1 Tax=Araneus ventricosus TaxID=182803 RepID=A0A4Y2N7W4_ARAVE|nr:hypothetical protein AVEN_185695-1 [Araneus ventricosus]